MVASNTTPQAAPSFTRPHWQVDAGYLHQSLRSQVHEFQNGGAFWTFEAMDRCSPGSSGGSSQTSSENCVGYFSTPSLEPYPSGIAIHNDNQDAFHLTTNRLTSTSDISNSSSPQSINVDFENQRTFPGINYYSQFFNSQSNTWGAIGYNSNSRNSNQDKIDQEMHFTMVPETMKANRLIRRRAQNRESQRSYRIRKEALVRDLRRQLAESEKRYQDIKTMYEKSRSKNQ